MKFVSKTMCETITTFALGSSYCENCRRKVMKLPVYSEQCYDNDSGSPPLPALQDTSFSYKTFQ